MSAQRVYAISDRNVCEINRRRKSKDRPLKIFLHFPRTRHTVAFDDHPFFSFKDLSDPGMACETLEQAQEAIS